MLKYNRGKVFKNHIKISGHVGDVLESFILRDTFIFTVSVQLKNYDSVKCDA